MKSVQDKSNYILKVPGSRNFFIQYHSLVIQKGNNGQHRTSEKI